MDKWHMTKNDIFVTPLGATAHLGLLRYQTHRARCALGAGGVTAQKKEGDTKTPLGRFALRRIWWRPDRYALPKTRLPTSLISTKSGWSDDISAADYNRTVNLPYAPSHERLWRYDRLYDVFIELGYNDAPPQRGAGSAIFLHLEKNNFQPTLGCIAVSRASMGFLLQHARRDTHIRISKQGQSSRFCRG